MISKQVFYALIGLIVTISYGDAYKGAVVEYSPIVRASGEETLATNIDKYANYISDAKEQGAEIIVFPEYGLTGMIEPSVYDKHSVYVSDVNEAISICENRQIKSKTMIDLSCLAKSHAIYVVVNVLEKVNGSKSDNDLIYYNTNVVFDRRGAIIAKYRKINLFDEPGVTSGYNLTTFKTDFGVTFGMFICFDVLYKRPALEIFENEQVTDVVFSTYWMSEVPFLTALSVHSGYARANGVNMLSSAISNSSSGSSGSGIYGHNGLVLKKTLNTVSTSQLLVAEVSKIEKRTPPTRDYQLEPRTRFGGSIPSADNLKLLNDSLDGYTFADLPKEQNFRKTVCSGKYCCKFQIEQSEPSLSSNYKLVAFYGSRYFGKRVTGGIRVCGVIACPTSDKKSCGSVIDKRDVQLTTFDSISINGTFERRSESFDLPTTLTSGVDVLDAIDYSFYKIYRDDQVNVYMKTNAKQSNLTTFAIYGRVFYNDNKPAGPINGASHLYKKHSLASLTLTAVLFYFLL